MTTVKIILLAPKESESDSFFSIKVCSTPFGPSLKLKVTKKSGRRRFKKELDDRVKLRRETRERVMPKRSCIPRPDSDRNLPFFGQTGFGKSVIGL